jgi:hypothetical protein
MKTRRAAKKSDRKRIKQETGEDAVTDKKPRKSIIVQQRVDKNTINSKLDRITGMGRI